MLTIKGPVRYQKPAEPQPDYIPAIERQRATLIAERDRYMREVRRVENILIGLNRAIELIGGEDEQSPRQEETK